MGKVISIEGEQIFQFRVKVSRYTREGKYEDFLFEKAIIVLVDTETDKSRVHQFTEFIIEKYGKNLVKTQVDYAGMLSRFLNFILKKKVKGNFKLIDFDDISYFLQSIVLDISNDTLKRYRRVIVDFYRYLAKKNWLYNVKIDEFITKEIEKDGSMVRYYDAPIPDIDSKGTYSKKRNTHIMNYTLQAMFLQVAIEEVNIIALGVAFQMFGGLREGEVINLTHSSLQCIGPFGRYGMLATVENRNLRTDLKGNQAKGYVKKPRKQQIYSPYNSLEPLYKAHIRKYKCADDSGAIFVNKNSVAMSLESYTYYFRKLKNIFLQRLKECENPTLKVEGDVLNSARWGTHIGRGIFTNNLSEYMTATELKIKRGDSCIDSSEAYIEDSNKLGEKYEENAEGAFKSILKILNIEEKGD